MKKLKTFSFILRFYFIYFRVWLIRLRYNLVKHAFNPTKDILYLEVFPINGAGFNYRVKKWTDLFRREGLRVDYAVLIEDSDNFFRKTEPENLPGFILETMKLRIRQIKKSRDYKTLIVRRSILLYNDYGDLFFEKMLSAYHPNIVLDIDDDTTRDTGLSNSFFQRIMLENDNHFYESLKYYPRFITGSQYLKELVLKKNENLREQDVAIVPTCVDYDNFEAKRYDENKECITLGWIGGNHNLPLLKMIIPSLNRISEKYPVELLVIAGVRNYDLGAKFDVKFSLYDIRTEIDELRKIDLGLMPLTDTLTNRGKCGFKLLQYMGLGIPGIAFAITVNEQIVEHGVNGWLTEQEEDWCPVLEEAILQWKNLPSTGESARSFVKKHYSFEANFDNYLKFVREDLQL